MDNQSLALNILSDETKKHKNSNKNSNNNNKEKREKKNASEAFLRQLLLQDNGKDNNPFGDDNNNNNISNSIKHWERVPVYNTYYTPREKKVDEETNNNNNNTVCFTRWVPREERIEQEILNHYFLTISNHNNNTDAAVAETSNELSSPSLSLSSSAVTTIAKSFRNIHSEANMAASAVLIPPLNNNNNNRNKSMEWEIIAEVMLSSPFISFSFSREEYEDIMPHKYISNNNNNGDDDDFFFFDYVDSCKLFYMMERFGDFNVVADRWQYSDALGTKENGKTITSINPNNNNNKRSHHLRFFTRSENTTQVNHNNNNNNNEEKENKKSSPTAQELMFHYHWIASSILHSRYNKLTSLLSKANNEKGIPINSKQNKKRKNKNNDNDNSSEDDDEEEEEESDSDDEEENDTKRKGRKNKKVKTEKNKKSSKRSVAHGNPLVSIFEKHPLMAVPITANNNNDNKDDNNNNKKKGKHSITESVRRMLNILMTPITFTSNNNNNNNNGDESNNNNNTKDDNNNNNKERYRLFMDAHQREKYRRRWMEMFLQKEKQYNPQRQALFSLYTEKLIQGVPLLEKAYELFYASAETKRKNKNKNNGEVEDDEDGEEELEISKRWIEHMLQYLTPSPVTSVLPLPPKEFFALPSSILSSLGLFASSSSSENSGMEKYIRQHFSTQWERLTTLIAAAQPQHEKEKEVKKEEKKDEEDDNNNNNKDNVSVQQGGEETKKKGRKMKTKNARRGGNTGHPSSRLSTLITDVEENIPFIMERTQSMVAAGSMLQFIQPPPIIWEDNSRPSHPQNRKKNSKKKRKREDDAEEEEEEEKGEINENASQETKENTSSPPSMNIQSFSSSTSLVNKATSFISDSMLLSLPSTPEGAGRPGEFRFHRLQANIEDEIEKFLWQSEPQLLQNSIVSQFYLKHIRVLLAQNILWRRYLTRISSLEDSLKKELKEEEKK